MATDVWIELPESTGGGGGGVTSLNGLTGALNLVAGTGISITPSGSNIIISNTEAGGTVTSVGLADSTGLFNITGSPVTTAGTLTLASFKSQAANTFLAAPNGSSGAPTFRLILSADLPTGNLTDVGTDGITITGGTNAVIGAGTSISQHVADTTHNGYLSSSDWNTFNSKQSALTFPLSPTLGGTGVNNSFNLTIGGTSSINGTFSGTSSGSNTGDVTLGTANGLSLVGQVLSLALSSTSTTGALSSTDWNTFNGKQATITIGALDAQTANANGLALVSNVLSTQSATASFPGMVNTTTQTFAGSKTFGSNNSDAATFGTASSTSSSTFNGGVINTTRTITGNLTLDTTTHDYIIFVTTSSGAISITLPAPVNGRSFIFKDITGNANTNNVTILQHASEKIEGIATSKIFQTPWFSETFVSNGTDWFLV